MKKLYSALVVLILCAQVAIAQQRQISGVVTSLNDERPIAGVTIIDVETQTGTITGVDGSYTLTLSPDAKSFTFSFMGYKDQVIEIGNQSVINVAMEEDMLAVDEVVVVAYGTGKKSTFTGSASVVNKDDIEKIATSNVSQALQGASTGVQVINSSGQPGADATIVIRGMSSVNASSTPLYVVDGVPYAGYISAINPSDIESITVLKDASATALYGSRAANGVIMITTKQGKSKNGTVNFKATFGFSDLAVGFPDKLNPQQYMESTWTALYNGQIDAGLTADAAAQYATNNLTNSTMINPYSVDQPVGLDGKLVSDADLLYEGDWQDALMQSRLRQEYVVDFSGQNDKTSYFVSAGYTNDKGIFTTMSYERFSARANVSSQVKDWLKIGANTSFSRGITDSPADQSTVWFTRVVPSIYPIYEYDYDAQEYVTDDNGNLVYDFGDNRAEWVGWNPLATAEYDLSLTTVDQISSRMFAEFTILPDLKFTTNFSTDYYQNAYQYYASSEYGFSAGQGGSAYRSNSNSLSYTINNLLTYNKTFGDHSISVLAGQEAYSYKYNTLYASKYGFPFEGLYELDSAAELESAGSSEDNYRLMSWLSRVEYDYKDRYYVSASFRTDGSSRFSAANRWGKFWSLGASWRMSEEEFMAGADWADNIKLRASYGATGNDQLSTYYAYQGLYATGYNDFGDAGVLISRLENEGLVWESNLQTNIGVDFTIFNKLSGSIEWFNKDSKDLLFSMPMAPSTGFDSFDANIGTVRNRGYEIQLSWNVMQKRDFNWKMDLNASHYDNTIVSIPQDVISTGYFRYVEGESRYNYWGAEWAGINSETGNDMWWMNVYDTVNGESVVVDRVTTEDISDVSSDTQKTYLGDALPDLFGGFTNTFNFKNFDFSFMLYYSIGGKLYDSDYASTMAYRAGFSYHPDILNGWSESNSDEDTIAKFSTSTSGSAGSYSSKYLYDNTFVRLRNLTLGYTLSPSLLKKMKMSQLRLFVQGDNLLTFGNAAKRGTDPEQSISGSTSYRFPTTKSVSFGIQMSL